MNCVWSGGRWATVEYGQYDPIVKLLALTGQRANEIAALRWDEIDLDRGVISLPGSRTKNGRPHEIPMSATVRALLLSQPRNDGRELDIRQGKRPVLRVLGVPGQIEPSHRRAKRRQSLAPLAAPRFAPHGSDANGRHRYSAAHH